MGNGKEFARMKAKVIKSEFITAEMVDIASRASSSDHIAANLNALLKYGYCSKCKLVPHGCEREKGCRSEDNKPSDKIDKWEPKIGSRVVGVGCAGDVSRVENGTVFFRVPPVGWEMQMSLEFWRSENPKPQ